MRQWFSNWRMQGPLWPEKPTLMSSGWVPILFTRSLGPSEAYAVTTMQRVFQLAVALAEVRLQLLRPNVMRMWLTESVLNYTMGNDLV